MLTLILVLLAGVVGGPGLSVIVRFTFTDNQWDAHLTWRLTGRGPPSPMPRVAGGGPVLAGALGVTFCLISAVLLLAGADAGAGVFVAAIISCLVGYAVHKWFHQWITFLAVLSLPLSVVLLTVAAMM